MADYLIMGGILAFLLFVLAFGAKYMPDGNDGFFDQQNTGAMRGFWCLVVILVHVPQAYRNTIQDLIGSFAYIGVTFFFMTSAYGLSVGVNKRPGSIKGFWAARLPKLIVPNWVTNGVFALLFFFILGEDLGLGSFIGINNWVIWLLGCYAAFWIGYWFHWKETNRRKIVCILVCALSMFFYFMGYTGMVQATTWCPEVFGFIWGVILFAGYDKIREFFLRKWAVKAGAACLVSMVLGVSYLLLKGVVFWGDYVLKIILGLSILCFILILNGKFRIGNNISRFLGDISYEVYLIHVPVFQLVEKLLPNIRSGGFILVSLVLTVLFAAVIHKICNILLTKLHLRSQRRVA